MDMMMMMMARCTSPSKIDLWNVKLRFRDESKMEGEYVVMVGVIHTAEEIRCIFDDI